MSFHWRLVLLMHFYFALRRQKLEMGFILQHDQLTSLTQHVKITRGLQRDAVWLKYSSDGQRHSHRADGSTRAE